MIFTKIPFGLKMDEVSRELIVHSSNGVFSINNEHMLNLLQYLDSRNFIDANSIKNFFIDESDELLDEDFEEIVSYLTQDVGVISPVNKSDYRKESVSFIVENTHQKNIVKNFFKSSQILTDDTKSDSEVILKCVFCISNVNRDFLENEIEKLSSGQKIIFIFQVLEYVVITPVYSKNSHLPCPICCYDYLTGNVYDDSSERINSLSEIYNNIDYRNKVPNLPLDDLDFAYTLQYLKQYIGILTGDGKSLSTKLSLEKCIVINPHNLSFHLIDVPYSYICSCTQKYFNQVKYARL